MEDKTTQDIKKSMDESTDNLITEIKESTDDQLEEVIRNWLETTRTNGMKIGAYFVSSAIYGTIERHLAKPKPSLRDYKRMVDDIIKIVSVQLKKGVPTSGENE